MFLRITDLKSIGKNKTEGNLYQRKSVTKVLAVIGLAALAVIAAQQFYLFAIFKDAKGAVVGQGGTVHLWLAIGVALIACVGGFFLFSRVIRYDKRNETHITSQGRY
jgi:amino acid permease